MSEDTEERNLYIYKASAGSGKTFTLTLRYITQLLDASEPGEGNGRPRLNHKDFGAVRRNRHRGILAITFTNKATGEMKARIIKELKALSTEWGNPDKDKRSAMQGALEATFGCTAQQLGESAKAALDQLLHDYSGFNVSTIDSFFQQVMRNLAYELDYPGDYEVTLDDTNVLAQSAKMMLDDLNFLPQNSPERTVILREMRTLMQKERAENGGNVNMFQRNSKVYKSLMASARDLFNEDYKLRSAEFDKWFAAPCCFKRLDEYLEEKRQQALVVRQQLTREALSTMGFLGLKMDQMTKAGADFVNECLGKNIAGFTKSGTPNAAYKSICGLEGKNAGSLFKKSAVSRLGDTILTGVHEAFARIARPIGTISCIDMIVKENRQLRFVLLLNKYIKRFRQENNIVVLADTTELLHRMMGRDQVPFVYEKMGVRLCNFLIDEFQDTSHLQWKNLQPLVENGLSEGHKSLIIGDEKQAIYRFRNSDSELLHTIVPRRFKEEAELHGESVDENTNWRSSRHVVAFNNTLFHRLGLLNGVDVYENVIQKVSKRDLDGYVRIFDAREEEIREEGPVTPEQAQALAMGDNKPLQCTMMVREIRRQLKAGYRPGEIAVLVATNDNVAEVAKWLQEEDIEVQTDEALFVRNSQAVRSILGIMGMAARATVGSEPADGFEPEHIENKVDIPDLVRRFDMAYDKAMDESGDEDEAVEQALDFAVRTQGGTDDEYGLVRRVLQDESTTLTSMVESIISRCGVEVTDGEIAYVSAFHDLVMDYANTYGNNLNEFLRWWEQTGQNARLATVEGMDAVRLMTIHKSKGLEWPCVHVPFGATELQKKLGKTTCWVPIPDRLRDTPLPPAIRVNLNQTVGMPLSPLQGLYEANRQAELTDGLNRTYVAYTRASRELCVYMEKDSSFYEQLLEAASMHVDTKERSKLEEVRHLERAKHPEAVDPETGELSPEHKPADVTIDLAKYVKRNEIKIGSHTKPKRDKGNDEATDIALLCTGYEVNSSGKFRNITGVDSLFGPETWADDDDGDANGDTPSVENDPDLTESGVRVHRLLSDINRPGDVERVLRRNGSRYGLTEQEQECVRGFFNIPELREQLAPWFTDYRKARNEMSLYMPATGKMRRMDRVVWTSDGEVHVLDYKTSAQPHDGYRSQVRHYRRLLTEALPGARVRMFLLYVAQGLIEEVKPTDK